MNLFIRGLSLCHEWANRTSKCRVADLSPIFTIGFFKLYHDSHHIVFKTASEHNTPE